MELLTALCVCGCIDKEGEEAVELKGWIQRRDEKCKVR